MKRKLCVAMAMCGQSKVCMLDEPTAGMDPAARRALWDMIVKQKESTYFGNLFFLFSFLTFNYLFQIVQFFCQHTLWTKLTF